jgi:hypothetical protein
VLDFIEYIEIKHGLRDRLTEELKQAQEPAMRLVWDNQEDEVWNGRSMSSAKEERGHES